MEPVRASDQERDGVVSRLKDAFAEGHVTTHTGAPQR